MNIEKLKNYLTDNFIIAPETLEIIENIINYLYIEMRGRYNEKIIIKQIYIAAFRGSRIDITIKELQENLL